MLDVCQSVMTNQSIYNDWHLWPTPKLGWTYWHNNSQSVVCGSCYLHRRVNFFRQFLWPFEYKNCLLHCNCGAQVYGEKWKCVLVEP